MIKKIFIASFSVLIFGAGVIMANSTFTLTSESIKNNQTLASEQVLNGFGCSG